MHLKNVTLELSSKPFRDESEKTMYAVCRTMFRQWKTLTDQADVISVMLWIADGSEILEYTGDLSQKFEWAYWCGCANRVPPKPNQNERQRRNTHHFPSKYIADGAPRPYSWLKRLIEVIREVGGEMTGKPVRIGAIFDNGPEFALSNFKFNKHIEIAQGASLYPNSFVVCNSTLHADPQAYAAYPNGIPEGTTLGEFLGRQFAAFSRDLKYDYIWLSNGMGFGTETWGITGALFDKQRFYPEKADEAAGTMLKFWRDFTDNCPGVVIETRGSNFSAGTEIATDAAPLRELYADFKIAPPVNSPWAALNYNSGLELAAWMSHVAELPDERFPFRYYIHDPWFMNSPWLDRYGREPWDIFQVLSISRIDAAGKVGVPNSISMLSVDDTFGRMPDQVPNEVIPHFFDAFDNGPDSPGPLVWVYAFDEYSELVRGEGERHPEVVFNEDMFLGETIQAGTPLNTVISTGNFRKLLGSGSKALDGAIWVVPASGAESVLPYLDAARNVIFYGSLAAATPELARLLKLENGAPVSGKVKVVSKLELDRFERGAWADSANILPQFDGGGLTEFAAPGDEGVLAHAVSADGEQRVLALRRELPGGGAIGFVRSILPCAAEVKAGRGLDTALPSEAYPVESLMRQLLATFGWSIGNDAFDADAMLLRTNISRHDNAFFFSLFARDTSVDVRVNTPYGAPILNEMETRIRSGNAIWRPGKSWHKECRCFVRQQAESVVSCKIGTAEYPMYTGRLVYSGLVDAEVRFFPPAGYEKSFEVTVSEKYLWAGERLDIEPVQHEWEETPAGRCALLRHVNGHVFFAW